jgi:hypothetical protein
LGKHARFKIPALRRGFERVLTTQEIGIGTIQVG